MANQIYFTLKFSQEGKTRTNPGKTRMHLDFVPPFDHQLNGRTEVPAFDPKAIVKALDFIKGEVMHRIVEHIRRTELRKGNKKWAARKKILKSFLRTEKDLDKAEKQDTSKYTVKRAARATAALTALRARFNDERKELYKKDRPLRKQVTKVINNWESSRKKYKEMKILNITFEQMSAAKTTYTTQSVANTDVPPPHK